MTNIITLILLAWGVSELIHIFRKMFWAEECRKYLDNIVGRYSKVFLLESRGSLITKGLTEEELDAINKAGIMEELIKEDLLISLGIKSNASIVLNPFVRDIRGVVKNKPLLRLMLSVLNR